MRKTSHKDRPMKWVDELFTKLPKKPAGWVTVNDISQQTGNNRRTVSERINNMVKNNILECMLCTDKGRRVKCYKIL